jgi:hypothetical protein
VNRNGLEFNLPATVALSAALTVGATAIANMDRSPAEVREAVTSVVDGEPGSHFAFGIDFDNLPLPVGHFSTSRTTETVAESTQLSHMTSTVPLYRSWALKFSSDPAATKPLENSELVKIDEAVAYIVEDGGKVTDVELKGHASDETHISITEHGTNPGLGAHNGENVDLANTRAKTALPIVTKALEQNLGHNVPITVEQGQEDVDMALEARIKAVAKRLGTSSTSLVMQYNVNEKSVPKVAREVLDDLKPGRRVDVVIHSEREVAMPTHSEATHDADGYVIPVILPILRRRKEEGEEYSEPTPDRVVPKPAPAPLVKRPVRTDIVEYPKADLPNARVMKPQHTVSTAHRVIQPRNHNFHAATQRNGGRMSRSHGGNRSTKRV